MSKKFIKGMSIIISSIGISVSLLTNSVYAVNSDSLENLNVTKPQLKISSMNMKPLLIIQILLLIYTLIIL